MITITIKTGIKLSRNEFEDLDDLQSYINSLSSKNDAILTPEIDEELNKRYKELRLGAVEGVAWKDVKEKYNKRISK